MFIRPSAFRRRNRSFEGRDRAFGGRGNRRRPPTGAGGWPSFVDCRQGVAAVTSVQVLSSRTLPSVTPSRIFFISVSVSRPPLLTWMFTPSTHRLQNPAPQLSPGDAFWLEFAAGTTKIWELPGGSSPSLPPNGSLSPVVGSAGLLNSSPA